MTFQVTCVYTSSNDSSCINSSVDMLYCRVSAMHSADRCSKYIFKLVKTLVFTQWLHMSSAYPGGAPDLACSSMFPSGHFSDAQTSSPPYKIITSKTAYKPGETISIDIFGEKTYFTGLYVQARLVGCHVNTTRVVGTFTANDPRLQTRHCFGLIHSAVTHTSSVRKDFVSVYWTAPVVLPGHLIFKATIVKDRTTFWVGVESTPLVDLQSQDTLICDNVTSDGQAISSRNYFKITESPPSQFNKSHLLYTAETSESSHGKSSDKLSTTSSEVCYLLFSLLTFHLLFHSHLL